MAFSRRRLLCSLGLLGLQPSSYSTQAASWIFKLAAPLLDVHALAADPADRAINDRERPEDQPRSIMCLNGSWDTVENVSGDTIPAGGWSPRRTPAMPTAPHRPVNSIWYRHKLDIPLTWNKPNRRFCLQIGKVGHYAALYWNGQRVGEHYGQYTPVEADVTAAVRPGEINEIGIYVHNAFGRYARPGIVITDPMEGNAYRGATFAEYQRNWTGIVGDIRLGWHPATYLSDVFVTPSVRNRRLTAVWEVNGHGPAPLGLTLRAEVLDGSVAVRQFPEIPVSGQGVHRAGVDWTQPVLWGPAPYGQPKLYTLRSDLLERGRLVDRHFTRFGFREVWTEGRDVLLNGKKLWVVGAYFNKLAPIRYLNDRHPQARMIEIMQQSGLNMLHGHWDELGDTWLDLCDEMGMLVLGGFFCDGRPEIQSKADPGWADWMTATCTQWVRANRHHPSIVMWRPIDLVPQNLINATSLIYARLAAQVRREDGTRPLADGSDIEAWAQGSLKITVSQFLHGAPKEFDDGSEMAQRLKASKKPFLTKEAYTFFPSDAGEIRKLKGFFQEFYAKAYAGGGTGFIVQHLPLVEWNRAFRVSWLSASGEGNRDGTTLGQSSTGPYAWLSSNEYPWLNWSGPGNPLLSPSVQEDNLPNWCDESRPFLNPSPYNDFFAALYRKFMNLSPPAYPGVLPGEVILTGLRPDAIALLMPESYAQGEVVGIRAGQDGTAWLTSLPPGRYRLFPGSRLVHVHSQRLPRRPGYSWVQRFHISISRE